MAYLNLKKDKEAGKHVNKDDYKKHRRDVSMAVASLKEGDSFIVPAALKKSISEFIEVVSEDSVKRSLMDSLDIDEYAFNMYLGVLDRFFEAKE